MTSMLSAIAIVAASTPIAAWPRDPAAQQAREALDAWPGYACVFQGLRDGTADRAAIWVGFRDDVVSIEACERLCAASEACVSYMHRTSTAQCWLYKQRPRLAPNDDFGCGRQPLSTALSALELLGPGGLYRGGEAVLLNDGIQGLTVDDVAFGYELLVNSEGLDGRMFGVRASQDPMTLALMQEHVWDLQPDLVVELGTECGGLSSILAELQFLRGVEGGHVLTVDIAPQGYAPWSQDDCERRRSSSELWHRHRLSGRLRAVLRDTVRWGCPSSCGAGGVEDVTCECLADDSALFALVAELARGARNVLVIDDASHFKDETIRNFELLGPFVTPGSLFIVADTRLDRLCESVRRLGYPVANGFNPGEKVKCDYYTDNGPLAAVLELFQGSALARERFRIDRSAERTVLNAHPGGWLRAI